MQHPIKLDAIKFWLKGVEIREAKAAWEEEENSLYWSYFEGMSEEDKIRIDLSKPTPRDYPGDVLDNYSLITWEDEQRALFKENYLKSKYKITTEQYENLVKQQNNLCSICLKPETAKAKNGYTKKLAVDHDHVTGKIRGLLCTRCNVALGYLNDSITTAERLINYLKAHKDTD